MSDAEGLPDYYAILQVHPKAEAEVVEAASAAQLPALPSPAEPERPFKRLLARLSPKKKQVIDPTAARPNFPSAVGTHQERHQTRRPSRSACERLRGGQPSD